MPEYDKKRCGHCKKPKLLKEFYRDKGQPDGRYKTCIGCYRELREPKRKSILAGRRRWHQRLRDEVLKHYGGKCECCKERMFEFLAIDHINGGGGKHRKAVKIDFTYWLKKNNFPPGYRVLCHNCNMAMGRYGYCPHYNPMI